MAQEHAMIDGLNIELHKNVLASPQTIFQRLEQEITYLSPEESKVRIRGKSYPIPRQHVAYGDSGLSYAFSGLEVRCKPWTPLLLEIKQVVEQISGVAYNFVLINRYKDGNSCIGQHKDNEKDLVSDHPIASLSLGQTRTFVLQRAGFPEQRYELMDNSLLMMKAPTNKHWTHGIPRQTDRHGIRINLTFRSMTAKRKASEEDIPHPKRAHYNPPDIAPHHLGGKNHVSVSDFANTVRVHIREYDADLEGRMRPTKKGVSLPVTLWFSLAEKLFYLNQPQYPDRATVIGNDLMLSTLSLNDQPYVSFQRYFRRNDNTLEFAPNAALLSAQEWDKLVELVPVIADDIVDISFGAPFCFQVIADAVTRAPNWSRDLPEDMVSILDTSLVEVVESHLAEAINKVFKCFGCTQGYENQLGHECLTSTRQDLLNRYEFNALAAIDFKQLGKDFVEKNAHIANYITGKYIAKANPRMLWKSAKEMYVATDGNLINFFTPL